MVAVHIVINDVKQQRTDNRMFYNDGNNIKHFHNLSEQWI